MRKEKLTEKATELHSLRDSVRPSDDFLFSGNFNRFIKNSTAQQIATWITTSRRAILNSVTKWAEHKKAGIQTVVGWLTLDNPDNTKFFSELRRGQIKQMEEQRKIDGRRRARRRHLATHPSRQQSMNGYVTLTRSA